jgi:hypothetical protein
VSITTRKLSDAHEIWLADLFGARRTKGSGNQWQNQTDGRMSSREKTYAFSYDGKATLGKSVGVTREMWTKVVEQALPERPMLPLRFYDNERLEVGLDLVVMSAYDAAEIIEDANKYRAILDQGCLMGIHKYNDETGYQFSDCLVCGVSVYDLPGVEN